MCYDTLRSVGKGAFGFVRLAQRKSDKLMVCASKCTVFLQLHVHMYIGVPTMYMCVQFGHEIHVQSHRNLSNQDTLGVVRCPDFRRSKINMCTCTGINCRYIANLANGHLFAKMHSLNAVHIIRTVILRFSVIEV